jgi:hypothetical protein
MIENGQISLSFDSSEELCKYGFGSTDDPAYLSYISVFLQAGLLSLNEYTFSANLLSVFGNSLGTFSSSFASRVNGFA